MATQLFIKQGTAIIEVWADAERVAMMLGNGYVVDRSELEADKPIFADADTNGSGKLSNAEVRAAAKKAGHHEWDTARIYKLKEWLGYDES